MENKIILSYGFYGQPDDRDWDWWWRHTVVNGKGQQVVKTQPRMFGGGSFVHRKQYGDFGLVLSGAYQQDQSYLQDNDYNFARFGAKLRYTPHKNRHVTMGINANFFYKKYHDFFLAKDVDSGMYQTASASAVVEQRTFNIDPYFNFYDEHDNRQQIKCRVFNVLYYSTTGDSTNTTEFMFDYNFQHTFRNAAVVVTAGVSASYTSVHGKTFADANTAIDSIRFFSNQA